MTIPTAPPAVLRAEALLSRVVSTLVPLSLRTKITLKGSDVRLLNSTIIEARQELRSLIPAPGRRFRDDDDEIGGIEHG